MPCDAIHDHGCGSSRCIIEASAYGIFSISSQNIVMTKRDLVVDALKTHMGLPYKWGGDDPLSGFDCSGLMIEILQAVGIIAIGTDDTAHGLSKKFVETDILQPGVMVYWDWNKDGRIDHVEMIALVDDDGEVYTIGASGGDSSTTNLSAAIFANGYVKMRPLMKGYILANDPFENIAK